MLPLNHPPPPQRVGITGIGAFTPYGLGWPQLWEALDKDRRALAPAGECAPQNPEWTLGAITDLKPFRELFPSLKPPLPIPATRFLLAAAKDAVINSGLDINEPRDDIGVIVERTGGPAWAVSKMMQPVLKMGPQKTRPLLFSQTVANAPLGEVARLLGLRGPNLLTVGGGAIMLATDAIRRGEANAVVCGGLHKLESYVVAASHNNGFFNLDSPPNACRPYATDTVRTAFGEGAVCVVLERVDAAIERGAHVYAELVGVACGLDPELDPANDAEMWGWGHPRGEAMAGWCRDALDEAALAPNLIDLHSGGGNACPSIDNAERDAMRRLGLGDLPLNSLKGHLGETYGMAIMSSIAWAANSLDLQVLQRAPSGRGAGAEPTDMQAALVMNIDIQPHYFSAILCRFMQ